MILHNLKRYFNKATTPPSINVFWWKQKKNFGDLFTPELINKHGAEANWTHESQTDLVGVGSLMHLVPTSFSGTFLGTGLIRNQKLCFPNAKYAAVRGELTKTNLQLDSSVITGDMGLLADDLLEVNHNCKYEIGVVPHFVDYQHPWIKFIRSHCKDHINIIDVRNSAKFVTEEISKCRRIYSSSLHGLIAADSLGIPNTWVKLSDKVLGGGFKFHDYNSSLDFVQTACEINSENVRPEKIDQKLAFKSLDTIRNKKNQLRSILTTVINSAT
jgi:pyruvyltransferase